MSEILSIEGFKFVDGEARNKLNQLEEMLSFVKSDINFLDGKNILIIGDSTTDNTTFPPNWVELFERKIANDGVNCMINTDLCINGQSFAGLGTNDIETINSIQGKFDYVVIQLGLNDCTGQFKIGKHSDTLARPDNANYSVIGCFNVIVNAIKTKWPDAIIFYNMPTQNQFEENTYPRPIPLCLYRAAYGEVCKRYGIRIIDNSLAPMLAPLDDRNGYIIDGLHPTEKYAPIFLDFIISQLKCFGSSTWANLHTKTVRNLKFGNDQIELYIDSNGKVRMIVAGTLNQSYDNYIVIDDTFPAPLSTPFPFIAMGSDINNKRLPVEIGFLDNVDGTKSLYLRHLTGDNNYIGVLYINFEYEANDVVNYTNLSI